MIENDGVKAPQRATASEYGRPGASDYAQVWGDVVALRDLRLAIPIGAVISLTAYLGASALFARFVEDPAMARAYGMLVGIVGCILSGAVCAVLFKPKRVVSERVADTAWHEQVIDQLAAERGGIGRMSELSAATASELKELGLYDLFAERSAREEREATGVAATRGNA
jgi:ammonia channel protein AmtB